jgi:hypothetical protein
VSRSRFYSLRKRKMWENSIESFMCNHPHFADTISRERFRRRGIRPYYTLIIPTKSFCWKRQIYFYHLMMTGICFIPALCLDTGHILKLVINNEIFGGTPCTWFLKKKLIQPAQALYMDKYISSHLFTREWRLFVKTCRVCFRRNIFFCYSTI